MIKTLDLAWAAGFLEGEGSFFSKKECGRGNYPSQIVVSAVQVQKEPLEKLFALFGGTTYGPYNQKARGSRQPYFLWSVGGNKAIQVMMTLYVLMSPKRKGQIEECLNVWKACAKQKTGPKPKAKAIIL